MEFSVKSRVGRSVGKTTPRWQGRGGPRPDLGRNRDETLLFRDLRPDDRRRQPQPGAICPAFHGDAGRRVRKYGDAVADAGDRPRARGRRPVGGDRLLPVGRRLGGDRAALGAPGRPSRSARADAARPLRLRRIDADLRLDPRPGLLRPHLRNPRLHRLRLRPDRLRGPGARPRRPPSRPISPPAPRASSAPPISPRSLPPSAWGRSSARRSRRSSSSGRSASPGRSSSSR